MSNKTLKSKKGYIDVVVGLQWGDEGKGKNIDELLSHGTYAGVARFQGGANAGHTLKFKDQTFIGHIIPSGCLQKNIELYLEIPMIIAKVCGPLRVVSLNLSGDCPATESPVISNKRKKATCRSRD